MRIGRGQAGLGGLSLLMVVAMAVSSGAAGRDVAAVTRADRGLALAAGQVAPEMRRTERAERRVERVEPCEAGAAVTVGMRIEWVAQETGRLGGGESVPLVVRDALLGLPPPTML